MNQFPTHRHLIALALVVVATHGSVPADEGRITITAPLVLTGDDISGRYVVTRNVSSPRGSGLPAIDIVGTGNEDIEIDLNGFTVRGDAGIDAHAIRAVGVGSLTVRNGTLKVRESTTSDGINVVSAGLLIVEDVKITGVRAGIYLTDVRSFAVRRNVISQTYKDGVIVGISPEVPSQGTIEDNLIQDARINGVLLVGAMVSFSIRNNRIQGVGLDGISVSSASGFQVEGNTVRRAANAGIAFRRTSECSVSGNVVIESGDAGVLLDRVNNCTIKDNNVSRNAGDGVRLGGSSNRIDGNAINANGGAGIWILPGAKNTLLGRNTGRGNGQPAGECSRSICPGMRAPEICDDGQGTASFGNNLLPGRPSC